MSHNNRHNLLLNRTFQYVGIILIAGAIGGIYWYWKNARAAVQTTDNRPSFEAPLTHDLNLTQGQGVATYSRVDGADRRATVTDFEGLIRPVKNGEARFEGARRVENLVTTTSEDFSNAVWTKSLVSISSGIADPNNGTSAMRMTATGANGFISRGVASVTGRTYTHSIWIRRVSGSGNVILHGNDIGDTVVTTTTSWKRFSNTFVATDGNSYAGVRLGTSGDVIDVAFAQMEEVTGQANQNPSEYVSVGIKTASPYHGAGADGVKYFDTENGNTVASNVVTEATGTAIATATLKGYLAEGARTNLVLRSEEIDNASWGKINSTISADVAATPGGRSTADMWTRSSTAAAYAQQSINKSASALTYTASIYVKSNTGRYTALSLQATYPNYVRVVFDLQTGTISSAASVNGTFTAPSATISSVGNGWYRVTLTTTSDTATVISPYLSFNSNNVGIDGVDSSSSSSGYIWGAQLEQAPFASSYIPTTTASVTRASDSLRYPETGNFGDTTGTVSLETTPNWTGGAGWNAHWVADSSSGVKLRIWHWTGAANHTGVDRSANNGATRNQIDPSLTLTQGTRIKIAAKWDSTALRQFNNGALAGSDTTLTLPYDSLANSLYIGSNNTVDHAFSSIKNVRAWKKALTDTELNGLTSLTQTTSDSATKKTTVKTPDNTGLVAYWSFEDGSGTKAEDFSASGTNTGTLTNGPTWVDGKFGKAASFSSASSQYVLMGNISPLKNAVFTYSAWVNPTSLSGSMTVFGGGAGSTPRMRLDSGSGSVSLINTNIVVMGTSSGTVSAGSWAHVAVSYDASGNYAFYVNGILAGSGMNVQSFDFGSASFEIGRNGAALNEYFNGKIDDVRIYDRALSQTEVADLYRSGSIAKINASQNNQLTSGLVGLWSFNGPDISGTTAYDRSGQANNGTLTNGPIPTIGKVGQALSFDGTNDYVNIASMSGLPSSAIAVSAWVKISTHKNWSHIAYHEWVGSNGSWLLFTDAAGKAIFGVYDTSQHTTVSSAMSVNTWYHVVGTYDGSNVRVYVNGVTGTPTSLSGVTLDNAGSVRISGDLSSSSFPGVIDEVRIYNRALTQAEISALYSAGR